MPHVVTRPPFTFFGTAAVAGRPNAPMEVHVIPAWEDNYAFIVVCRNTGEAAVVDAPEAKVVLDYAATQGFRLTTILNTHTHPDHIGINRDLEKAGKLQGPWRLAKPEPGEKSQSFRALGEVRKEGGSPPSFTHSASAGKLYRVFGCPDRGIPGLTDPVDEGSTFTLGALPVQVMRTEGHQDGHLSYVIGDVVFCGDTLFAGGCGYLFDGPPAKMHNSLTRLAALPPETRICCAHEYTQDNLKFAWSVEPDNTALAQRIIKVRAQRAIGMATIPSTIGEERATNPFLRTHAPTLRTRVAAALEAIGRTLPLDTPAEVFTATRILKDLKLYRTLADEDLPQ